MLFGRSRASGPSPNTSNKTSELDQHGKPKGVYYKIYTAFGFTRPYSFPLYFITVGALFGFSLARLQYLNTTGIFFKKALPGEAFWLRSHVRHIGIILHLVGVLFGAILAALQFTPVIRHKFIMFHRIAGHFAILFLLLGNVGAFMIMDKSVGGTPVMRAWVGLLGAMTTLGLVMAYVNIKRLQIDQHRAWMIRTWSWAACIITLRIIMVIGLVVAKAHKIEQLTPFRCDNIASMYAATVPARVVAAKYPSCGPNPASSSTYVLVSSLGQPSGPENAAAILHQMFWMAGWMALIIHVFLVELYLWLTPAESYRLRVVSYQRQVERGLRTVDSPVEAGLTSTRFGDAPHWWALPRDGAKGVDAAEAGKGAARHNSDADAVSLSSGNTLAVPTSDQK